MPKVTIICDQNYLKNVSAIERVLQQHGGFYPDEAKRIAISCAGDKPVHIEVDNAEQAKDIVENLNKIMDVNASVQP